MKASIIIPAKNGGERFERAVKSIFENSLSGGFEVIVIDSGSTDDTLHVVKEYPIRPYKIPSEEFSHGKVRNYGARLSGGEFLVFLSQDAIPTSKNWLSRLIDAFNDDDSIVGVYGRQISDGDNLMETFFLLNTYGERHEVRSLPSNSDMPSLKEIFFSNANSAIRKSVWHKIPFNERLNMSEDQEWSKRALLAGYKIVYEPDAAVYHSHNYSILSIFRRNYESGFSLRGVVKVRPMFCEALSYLKRELNYIIKTVGVSKVPYALIYELSRHTGFAVGSIMAWLRNDITRWKGFSVQGFEP